MSSSEPSHGLTPDETRVLLDVASRSIERAVLTGVPLEPVETGVSPTLRSPAATFVTVERHGELLGCIGSIHARMPLVDDVAKNAFGAVTYDPRCPALRPSDVPGLDVHISILSDPAPLEFDSEADLLRQLRPGIDGLVLEDGFLRGTFLPVVWETLPDPREFLDHLKMKAGLPSGYWSDTLRVSRYTTDVIHGTVG